jgi:malonate-semialdehyde dehydrogenase (acetylating)/methylmalonate-semialdehyde dehydrogenase
MIVLPDADIDMAADAAVSAGYGSAGERCMAIATIVPSVTWRPARRGDQGRLPEDQGRPGTDPTAEMGPLVTGQHRDKVASYLDSGRGQGATVVADGRGAPALQGLGRLLPGRVADRQGDAVDGLLPRRDLRPGPDRSCG